MERDIRWWLNHLPPEPREKALQAHDGPDNAAWRASCVGQKNNGLVSSLSDALAGAFNWGYSPEGRDYWTTVSIREKAKSSFDPLCRAPVPAGGRFFAPASDWIEAWGHPRALAALRNVPLRPCTNAGTLDEALEYAFDWARSAEGSDFWYAVHSRIARESCVSFTILEAVVQASEEKWLAKPAENKKKGDESPENKQTNNQQTNIMQNNIISKYAATPVATPTLVFGQDVSEMSADELLAAITTNNGKKAALVETGVTGSKYVDKQMAALDKANAALLKQLDSLA